MRTGHASSHDHASLWTIQPASVWSQIESTGSAWVDRSKAPYGAEGLWQYDWLAAGLSRRIEGYEGRYPWWAYCEKPDLRTHRHGQIGEQVRIEFRPTTGSWVRFPIWMWDTIYSGRFLARSYAEFNGWMRELLSAKIDEDTWPLPEPLRGRLEQSWERLFDRSGHGACWLRECDSNDPCLDDYWPAGAEHDRQEAVGETLHLSEVVDIRPFVGTAQR